jgi:UrcA family protein
MNTSKHVLAVAAGLAVGIFNVATSVAATPSDGDVRQVVVRYADLNLATPEGAARLHQRIVAAAKRVCPDAHIRNLYAAAQAHECQADAIRHAVNDVNNVRLSAIYAAKSHGG